MGDAVLVTGGAGFIGSSFADKLLEMGIKTVSVDNFDPYYNVEYKRRNIRKSLDNSNYTFIKEDVKNTDAMEKIISGHGITKIAHFAATAAVRPSIEKPLYVEDNNVKATIGLLELCRKFAIRNFVFASTSAIYGVNEKIPFSEKDHVFSQVSPYGISKRACELYCQYYNRVFSVPTVCLRFFTVYGPRQRPDMAVHKFTRLIDTGKEIEIYGANTRRDYTYISDIVEGVYSALNRSFDFEVINLGNNVIHEISDVIAFIQECLGKEASVRHSCEQPGDVPVTFADIRKAKKLLGYRPQTTLKNGVKAFIEWYTENVRDLA